MNPRLLVVLTLVLAGLCAGAGSAHAAGCTASYSSLTHRVIVQACNADPDAPVVATISRTEAGAILLDGNEISGDPTVTNNSTAATTATSWWAAPAATPSWAAGRRQHLQSRRSQRAGELRRRD